MGAVAGKAGLGRLGHRVELSEIGPGDVQVDTACTALITGDNGAPRGEGAHARVFAVLAGQSIHQRFHVVVVDGLGNDAVAARGSAFALASSEERSFGAQVIGVQPEYEPRVSSLPGLIADGNYLSDNTAAEAISF